MLVVWLFSCHFSFFSGSLFLAKTVVLAVFCFFLHFNQKGNLSRFPTMKNLIRFFLVLCFFSCCYCCYCGCCCLSFLLGLISFFSFLLSSVSLLFFPLIASLLLSFVDLSWFLFLIYFCFVGSHGFSHKIIIVLLVFFSSFHFSRWFVMLLFCFSSFLFWPCLIGFLFYCCCLVCVIVFVILVFVLFFLLHVFFCVGFGDLCFVNFLSFPWQHEVVGDLVSTSRFFKTRVLQFLGVFGPDLFRGWVLYASKTLKIGVSEYFATLEMMTSEVQKVDLKCWPRSSLHAGHVFVFLGASARAAF